MILVGVFLVPIQVNTKSEVTHLAAENVQFVWPHDIEDLGNFILRNQGFVGSFIGMNGAVPPMLYPAL